MRTVFFRKAYRPLFLLAAGFILLSGCTAIRSGLEYRKAGKENTISAYEGFLKHYPDHKQAGKVRDTLGKLYELRDWEKAKNTKAIADYEYFISTYPSSKYMPEAKKLLAEATEKKEYEDAVAGSDLQALEAFLAKYPGSYHIPSVEKRIKEVKEDMEWASARANNTIQAYEAYILKYPAGRHFIDAKYAVFELKNVLPEWEKTLKANTENAYKSFVAKYPKCSYAPMAFQYLKNKEDEAWKKALEKTTLQAIQEFIKNYPASSHKIEADKKIIDLELDAIFAGKYAQLPAAEKVSDIKIRNEYSSIEIHNGTGYLLTVWYSGKSDSKKITVLPYATQIIELPDGEYRVAATINGDKVYTCAGMATCSGVYSIKYSIGP
ncbi:MAG: hypothetical protein AB1458_06580 [Bacteroidota bacterium]